MTNINPANQQADTHTHRERERSSRTSRNLLVLDAKLHIVASYDTVQGASLALGVSEDTIGIGLTETILVRIDGKTQRVALTYSDSADRNDLSRIKERFRGSHKMITVLLVCLFFSIFGTGWYRIYLGHWKTGILQWLFVIAGFFAALIDSDSSAGVVVAFGLWGALGLWVFWDFVMIVIDRMKDSKGYYLQR